MAEWALMFPGMMRNSSRLWFLLSCYVVLFPAGVHGQGIPLSVHFGALSLPTPEPVWEFGIVFDRFTDHTKPEDSSAVRDTTPLGVVIGDSSLRTIKTRHYALRAAFGTQALYLSHSRRWRQLASVWHVGLFSGRLEDQPSRWLQNDFRHRDLEAKFVPVRDTLNRKFLIGGYGGIDRWVDVMPRSKRLRMAAYAGLQGQVSNLYDEAVLRFGLRTTHMDLWGWTHAPMVAVNFNKGFYVTPKQLLHRAPRDPTLARPKELLASTYQVLGGNLRFPLHLWFRNRALVPDFVLGFSSHEGFFKAKLDTNTTGVSEFRRLGETYQTFAFLWANGDVALETYNDSPGNKDIGPTFGARLYGRWRYWGDRR